MMLLGATGLLQAQQISNGGFERWDTLGDYSQPSNWYTLNKLTEVGFDASTLLSTESHSGNFAVLLESKEGQFADLSGVLCTGPLLNERLEPDFSQMKVPYFGRPDSLIFWYKADPEAGDTSIVSMTLTRWNSSLQIADTIGSAFMLIGDSVPNYTRVSLAFTYYSNVLPDSMYIIATSSINGFNPTPGTRLWLDDLEVKGMRTSIQEQTPIEALVYPNPASTTVQIHTNEKLSWELFSAEGKSVLQGINTQDVEVSGLTNGIYMLMLRRDDGSMKSVRLLVQ